MSDFLLDTNALSELTKKKPNPGLIARLRSLPAHRLSTSALCVTELRYGAVRRPDRDAFWKRIAEQVLARIRVLPFGAAEALRAGDLFALLDSKGSGIGVEDVLIGATALERKLTIVTRNVRHFERLPGLSVESWWT